MGGEERDPRRRVGQAMTNAKPISSLQGALRRPRLTLAGALAAALALGMVAALAAGTQVYDPKTHQWISYDRTKAYQYWKKNKQVPPAFRPQVVAFRTAEQPGTIIID